MKDDDRDHSDCSLWAATNRRTSGQAAVSICEFLLATNTLILAPTATTFTLGGIYTVKIGVGALTGAGEWDSATILASPPTGWVRDVEQTVSMTIVAAKEDETAASVVGSTVDDETDVALVEKPHVWFSEGQIELFSKYVGAIVERCGPSSHADSACDNGASNVQSTSVVHKVSAKRGFQANSLYSLTIPISTVVDAAGNINGEEVVHY